MGKDEKERRRTAQLYRQERRLKSLLPVAIEMFEAGNALADIANELDFPITSLRGRLRSRGVIKPKKPRAFGSIDAQSTDLQPSLRKHIHILHRFRAGEEPGAIAKQLGTTPDSVHRWLSKAFVIEREIVSATHPLPYVRYWGAILMDGQTYVFLVDWPDYPLVIGRRHTGPWKGQLRMIPLKHPFGTDRWGEERTLPVPGELMRALR